MPRQARIDIPGYLQHVIVRGIAQSDIFMDDDDRFNFVNRLKDLLSDGNTHCYAWALLDNHVHLLLKPLEQPLAQLMRRLLTGYAVSFNLRHKRSGHLFQNRYQSIICDSDSYLLELIRYIHLNPLRAGIVADLDELAHYRWSGHPQLVGHGYYQLIPVDEVLVHFSERKNHAIKRYLQFLRDGLNISEPPATSAKKRRPESKTAGQDADKYDDRILGEAAFVDHIYEQAQIKRDLKKPDLNTLVNIIAQYYQLDVEELQSPWRQSNIARAKAALCYLAIRRHRLKGADVAARLRFSPSAASQATIRGQKIFKEDEKLRHYLEQLNY